MVVVAAAGLVCTACHGTFRELPPLAGTTQASRVEPALSQAGTEFTGNEVEVRCWSAREWNEFVEDSSASEEPEYLGQASGDGVIDLSPVVCGPLASYLYEPGPLPRGEEEEDLAEALGVFAHELEHALGVVDEQQAECNAVQRMAGVGRALGMTGRHARALARVYWRKLYPENDELYLSDECRNGGDLDLRPGDSAWP